MVVLTNFTTYHSTFCRVKKTLQMEKVHFSLKQLHCLPWFADFFLIICKFETILKFDKSTYVHCVDRVSAASAIALHVNLLAKKGTIKSIGIIGIIINYKKQCFYGEGRL